MIPMVFSTKSSHANEISRPYYYSVQLDCSSNGPIKAEISAATRSGLLRFTFPKSDQARIIIQGINLNPELGDWSNDYGPRLKSLKGYVHLTPNLGEITGYNPDRQSAQLGPELANFKGYFVIQCDKEFSTWGTWKRPRPCGECAAEEQSSPSATPKLNCGLDVTLLRESQYGK